MLSLFDHIDPFLKGLHHEKNYFMVIDLFKEKKSIILLWFDRIKGENHYLL
jgi:hypothetical protein